MKGTVIQVEVLSQTATPVRSGSRYIIQPLSAKLIDEFKRIAAPAYIKNELPRQMMPFLKAGGFIYGSDLYSKPIFVTDKNKYKISALVRITFEDTNNEGKAAFMKKVQRTGLLNSGKIVKQYGTI